jgi:hypothetical protein
LGQKRKNIWIENFRKFPQEFRKISRTTYTRKTKQKSPFYFQKRKALETKIWRNSSRNKQN